MRAVVSIPLRAAFKVLRGVETDIVTEDGPTEQGSAARAAYGRGRLTDLAKVLIKQIN